ncbi:MAG: DNA polymerase III subunit delta [Sciscionella sp.]
MSAPAGTAAPLHLVLGDEELLLVRAVSAVLAEATRVDSAAELTRVGVSELTRGEFAELVSPSLFASARVIVLAGGQDTGKEIGDAIVSYCAEPADGIVLVVLHNGGGRSKAAKDLPGALRKAGAQVTECAKITRPAEREAFVRDEVRRAGGRIDGDAVSALIDAVGHDLRELASAASQLVADTGGAVDTAAVRRYHWGRAEVTGFVVAEKAVNGDRAGALEALRWAMVLGVPHVLVADALADAVRTVARVYAAPRSDPARLASELGMPPWKVRRGLAQARGWEQPALGDAMRVVASVNAEVKGVAADADYALERAVLRIAAARARR